MLFNSIEFAIFLPMVFLLYWLVFDRNLRLQNLFVLVVSYVFYGWWDWRFLILIVITSFFSWISGLLIRKRQEIGETINYFFTAKRILFLNIALNLVILGFFKYYNFFVDSFAELFSWFGIKMYVSTLKIILPIGISFYTFQALSYSIDVYKRKLNPTNDIVEFFAYVAFFPQLVAGPIERATNLLPQFQKKRIFDHDKAFDGVCQILWGLFKKIVIADNCAVFVNQVFSSYSEQAGSTLALAAILFTFQIYGDFSGYSDIAIGCAKLFGFNLMRNFDNPYFSRNIGEFWRRWHISLTTWFRDYIYIPLGGSRTTKIKVIRNTFVIFLVSGLWHGANWTFVVWGLYHAFLFVPLLLIGCNRKYTGVISKDKLLPTFKEFIQMFVTFILVVIGWVIFRSESIADVVGYFNGMLHVGTIKAFIKFFTAIDFWWLIVVMLLVEWFSRGFAHGLAWMSQSKKINAVGKYLIISLLIDIIIIFAADSQSFIYFQF